VYIICAHCSATLEGGVKQNRGVQERQGCLPRMDTFLFINNKEEQDA